MSEHWLERWQEGRTGWHQDGGHAGLRKHWRGSGRTVLVPLCGKSVDLLWLAAQGNRVVGVELSDLAIRAFFAEQQLDYRVTDGPLPAWSAIGTDITIYCGNFFELEGVECDAHFDRGALIALPPQIRPAYAAHVNSLLADSAEQLIVTVVYDEQIATGPPFSVDEKEVLEYWPQLTSVDQYDDIGDAPPKFVEAGLESMLEVVWRSS